MASGCGGDGMKAAGEQLPFACIPFRGAGKGCTRAGSGVVDERRDLGALDVADRVGLQSGKFFADGEHVLVGDLRVDVADRARCVLRRARGGCAVLDLDFESRGDVDALRCHKASSFRGTFESQYMDSWYRAPAAGHWGSSGQPYSSGQAAGKQVGRFSWEGKPCLDFIIRS